jgi:hypothetical protein
MDQNAYFAFVLLCAFDMDVNNYVLRVAAAALYFLKESALYLLLYNI